MEHVLLNLRCLTFTGATHTGAIDVWEAVMLSVFILQSPIYPLYAPLYNKR